MILDVIATQSLDILGSKEIDHYLLHLLCYSGCSIIRFNGKDHKVCAGECAVIRATQLIETHETSDDFKGEVIFVKDTFIEKSTPNCNYGIRGSLSLFQNPVMHLLPDESKRLESDFAAIKACLDHHTHHFHNELIINAIQRMILDLFDFHARIYGEYIVQDQEASILSRFIKLLEKGEFKNHREVSWYASELCVVPKYLSEVCKKVSGFSANYWINRFTILEITRELRDRSLTIGQIAESYGFCSTAYFNRYVQRFLGESPTEYRK